MNIKIKTAAEISLMRQAGKYLAEVKQIVYDAIKPGISTQKLQDLAEQAIKERNCKSNFKNYNGFPAVLCASVNEEMIHGIPSSHKILQEGDIIKIDIGLIYRGWHSDSAFTKPVGQVSKQNQKLIQVAKDAFYAGIDAIKPGARLGDVSAAIGALVKNRGYFVPYEFTGHGIGQKLHEDPPIPNYGERRTGPLLKDGMVLAIEPMILQNSAKIAILNDNWTVVSKDGSNTSHYEHTIAIIDGKVEILTGGI